jgi:hypothetical protein
MFATVFAPVAYLEECPIKHCAEWFAFPLTDTYPRGYDNAQSLVCSAQIGVPSQSLQTLGCSCFLIAAD